MECAAYSDKLVHVSGGVKSPDVQWEEGNAQLMCYHTDLMTNWLDSELKHHNIEQDISLYNWEQQEVM